MPTPCPFNGNCMYNIRIHAGCDFCILPRCIHPDEQRRALIRAITRLAVKPYRTPAQEEKLQRYRRYFRELNHRGGGVP